MTLRSIFVCFVLHMFFTTYISGQVTSPANFLGYEIGDRFTYFHTVEAYFKKLAEESDQIQLEYYGKSYEGKPLFVAYISSPSNIERLNTIRKSNLARAGITKDPVLEDQPAIVWLSYNIHGNEAVSTETAMLTTWELLTNPEYNSWLTNTVVVVDPCLNPDGHTRYVQFYTERVGFKPNPAPMTREHFEPWPGGRPNHYLFDLNRDWAWQTQIESVHRIELLNKWLPHVHVDFHEMGFNSPYYFAPSSEPIHLDITPWQREFQQTVGKHLGKAFDERNWLYFAGEIFDLFYPSYGDTYPAFNGSIGMTYEQGGSGRAGLAVITDEGDTLTLKNRIDHHHIAGLYTIDISHQNAEQLVQNFEKYYTTSKSRPTSPYKTIVVKNNNRDKIKSLAQYLDRNGIQYGYGVSNKGAFNAYSYTNLKSTTLHIDQHDMVISMHQPKSVLVKVLFEQQTTLPDSNTYDITAWSLPYARGLDAYTIDVALQPMSSMLAAQPKQKSETKPLAYAVRWKSLEDAKFLSHIWQKKINPRITHKPIKYDNLSLDRGTLIFTRNQYEHLGDDFDKILQEVADQFDRELLPLYSGYPNEGPSFGSSSISRITPPRIGLIAGAGTSTYNVGEIWHLLEQELGYPVNLYEINQINNSALEDLDVLIIPSLGYGGDILSERFMNLLKPWLNKGGKAIAIEGSVAALAAKGDFEISHKDADKNGEKEDEELVIEYYSERYRKSISKQNPGSIFSVHLDPTHPLAYGYEKLYFNLKTNNHLYAPLKKGWNVGISGKTPLVTGFVGAKLNEKMEDFLVLGIENVGRGQIVYFCDNPIFRSFWENGKLLFSNALFIVGNN